ncbi:MAG: ABC transporter permease [Nitrospirota bacterium]
MTKLMTKLRIAVLFALPVIGFVLLWEIFSRSGAIDSKLFPPPTVVAMAFAELIKSGEIFRDTGYSVGRAIIGFAIGAGLGVFVGTLTGAVKVVRNAFLPLIQVLRPIPSISLVPLAIVWFGLGEVSKIFLVTWSVFFPVWLNTFLGVTRVDPVYVWAASSLGASKRASLLKVILPASLPLIMGGMRVGVALAYMNLVAAEMAGAYVGLGFRLEYGHMVFRIDQMLVAIVMIGILGALSDRGFTGVVETLLPWSQTKKR